MGVATREVKGDGVERGLRHHPAPLAGGAPLRLAESAGDEDQDGCAEQDEQHPTGRASASSIEALSVRAGGAPD